MPDTAQELIPALTRAYHVVAGAGTGPEDVKDALSRVEAFLGPAGVSLELVSMGGTDSPFVRRLLARDVTGLVLGPGMSLGDVVRFLRALHTSARREDLEAHARAAREGGLILHFRETGSAPSGLARSIRELFTPVAPAADPHPSDGDPGPVNGAGVEDEGVVGDGAPARRVFHAGVLGRDDAPPEEPREGSDSPLAPLEEAVEQLVTGKAPEGGFQGLESQAREAIAGGAMDAVAALLLQVGEAVEARPDLQEPGAQLAQALAQGRVVARLVARVAGRGGEGDRIRFLAVVRLIPGILAPALAEALADDLDRRARRLYLEALSTVGDHGMEVAVSMLEDPRWFVVRNGVILLGDLGGDDVLVHLTQALAHPDPRVRREAVMALAKLGGNDAAILLLGMLGDGDPDVRSAVVLGLGVLKVERALRPLLESLDSEEDEDLQVAILRSLGQLGDPSAVLAIEKRALGTFFTRPPRPIRIAAYRALAAIGTPHARGLLEEAKEDKDPEVRSVVLPLLTGGRSPEGPGSAPVPEAGDAPPEADA